MMAMRSSLLRNSSLSLLSRQLHLGGICFSVPNPAPVSVEKSALAKLRRSTGYSFTRCKEALEKHDNDLKQAETWLRNQAQAHGWQKATKLQGRSTAQGLISVLASPNNAVIVEVNCETDFVARNKKFQSLVHRVTQACFTASGQDKSPETFLKKTLEHTDLGNVATEDSRMTKDEIAISIGEIGENIQARRALFMQSSGSVVLAGYTHPASLEADKPTVQTGKFGAIVAFSVKKNSAKNQGRISEIGRQLCQHIVGMNPLNIGSMDEPEPKPRKMKEVEEETPAEVAEEQGPTQAQAPQVKAKGEGITEGEITDETTFVKTEPEVDETVLLNQEFLLDPELTVRDFLIENSIEVVDFVRFECGESLETQ